MSRVDPPEPTFGAVAQLGERLICIQEVVGSIPISSTKVGAEGKMRGVLRCTFVGSTEQAFAAERSLTREGESKGSNRSKTGVLPLGGVPDS